MGTNRAANTIEPKVLNSYRTTQKVEVLRSTAAPTDDFWSVKDSHIPPKAARNNCSPTRKAPSVCFPGGIMTPIEYIDRALALVVDRLARYPGYEVLLSAEKQLQYIRSVLLDRSLDRSALHRLTLGSIAVKEFDETDPELSRALKDAYYVGIRTGRGLKVDLP